MAAKYGVQCEKFRAAKAKSGLTGDEIAKRLKVHKGTVRMWLCDAQPVPPARLKALQEMAR